MITRYALPVPAADDPTGVALHRPDHAVGSDRGEVAGAVPPVDPGVQPGVQELLALAVDALGGTPRSGQQEMAAAVMRALESGEHLLVQAGTGTGKSMGYLVPAVAHAMTT